MAIKRAIAVGGPWEQVNDDQAQLWSLFGYIPGQGLQSIGDFATR